MGFEITGGNVGILGAVMIVIAISAAIIVAVFFVAAARQARTSVREDEDGDLKE